MSSHKVVYTPQQILRTRNDLPTSEGVSLKPGTRVQFVRMTENGKVVARVADPTIAQKPGEYMYVEAGPRSFAKSGRGRYASATPTSSEAISADPAQKNGAEAPKAATAPSKPKSGHKGRTPIGANLPKGWVAVPERYLRRALVS